MLLKTRAIVLHTVRYAEKSLVVTLYTEKSGRQTVILHGARGAGARNKAAVIQPLYLLDTESYVHKNREVQLLKDVRLSHPYLTIPYDVSKSAQLLFLAEILRKILQEEEAHPALFDFMESALLFLDMMEQGSSHFHLWFLVRLTGFLGIFPQESETGANRWFDMKKGTFVFSEPGHMGFMDRETTALLLKIMGLNINGLGTLKVSREQRNLLLDKILEYLHYHFGNLIPLKSLPVLKELFGG